MNTRAEPTDDAQPVGLQVGEWSVAPELNRISREGDIVRLEPKAIELLTFLARRPGQVVSREELLAALWPGVIVGDNTLTQSVAKLRKALGDSVRQPAYIEAIAKRGYRLIAPVQFSNSAVPWIAPAHPSTPSVSQPLRWWAVVVSIVAVATMGVTFWLARPAMQGDTLNIGSLPAAQSVSGNHPTVFVRPFDATAEESQRLIARGLTADLVNDLSKISGLRIVSGIEAGIPHQSSDTVAQRPTAGRYLLTGTVLIDGDRLRLHVRLTEADGGQQLWTQRFDRGTRDLFGVQDEVVRRILEQLPVKVSQAETARIAHRYTRNIAAYEYFLRGQTAVQARRNAQNELAREMYWKAIQLDPAFSRAYAGLAMTYALAYQQGWADVSALDRAEQFAGTAMQMRPGVPEAHWALGFVHAQRRQHAAAIKHLGHALRLNPSYADAFALMGGIKTYIGIPAETVSLLHTALRLNSDAGSLYFLLLGRAYYFLGDHEQARVNVDQALARNAENLEARIYLAAILSQLGEREAAAWQVDEIRVMEPNFDAQRWLNAYPMTDARQLKQLVQTLRALGL